MSAERSLPIAANAASAAHLDAVTERRLDRDSSDLYIFRILDRQHRRFQGG
jgi:hypothetical protein